MSAEPRQPRARKQSADVPVRSAASEAGNPAADAGPTAPADDLEPTAARAPAPLWPFVLMGLVLYAGGLYVDARGGGFHPQVYEPHRSLETVAALQPKSAGDEILVRGRKVYSTYCQVCHQASGLGAPGQFPPLAGSEWVLVESPNRLIRLVLNGIQGPIEVKGQPFNNAMPPWKDLLSDEDIAAVLTFIRKNKDWGNAAGEVKPAQVQATRAKVQDRSDAWSAAELLAIPLGDD